MGVAAGLASAGKKVFAVSPSCFLSARSLEQIKNDVAYSNQPVNVIGIRAGVSYGALGSTHHSIHDVAVLRAINNINIVVPADNFETQESIRYAADSEQPFFFKFGKKPMPHLPRMNKIYEFGKASTLCEGKDVAFIATGETVHPSFEAAKLLQRENLTTEVISMHTIKPLDEETIIRLAEKCSVVITVEEHSVNGGLGEACASLLMQQGVYVTLKIIGIPDEDTVTGSQGEIFNHYGINGPDLAKLAIKLIGG